MGKQHKFPQWEYIQVECGHWPGLKAASSAKPFYSRQYFYLSCWVDAHCGPGVAVPSTTWLICPFTKSSVTQLFCQFVAQLVCHSHHCRPFYFLNDSIHNKNVLAYIREFHRRWLSARRPESSPVRSTCRRTSHPERSCVQSHSEWIWGGTCRRWHAWRIYRLHCQTFHCNLPQLQHHYKCEISWHCVIILKTIQLVFCSSSPKVEVWNAKTKKTYLYSNNQYNECI